MICPNCGSVGSDGQLFCQNCGTSLKQPEVQQPEVQQTEVQQPVAQQPEAQQPVVQQPVVQQPVAQQPVAQQYVTSQQQVAQPVYQQPVYQPMQSDPNQIAIPGKGMGIASMVLGIVSVALFCAWYLAIPSAIVGLILGGLSYTKAKAAGVKNGMAVAGIVCSCVAIGIALIVIVCAIAACSTSTAAFNSFSGF